MTSTEIHTAPCASLDDDDQRSPRLLLLLGCIVLIVLIQSLWRTEAGAAEPEPQAAPASKDDKPRPRRFLLFTAAWCGPCQTLKGDLQRPERTPAAPCAHLLRAGWTIGPEASNHIQVLDADRYAELAQQYRIRSLPTLVLIDRGQELGRLETASLTPRQIAVFYNTTGNDLAVRSESSGSR